MKQICKYGRRTAVLAALFFSALTLSCVSCRKMDQQDNDPAKMRKVLLLYADGYNNLPGYMADDIEDLSKVSPREYLRDRYTVLALRHFATYSSKKGNWDYDIPTSPVLLELHKDSSGNVITDTVKVYPDTMVTSSIHGMRTVLSDVKTMYPAGEYGMIYSSHGTGWIPVEYYNRKSFSDGIVLSTEGTGGHSGYTDLPYNPLFKSLGCHAYYQGSSTRTKEMDVRMLVEAFPMHMKYIIFDACLMGGIETAYQLRDVADKLIFVSTEVPAGGFDYLNLPERVLYPATPDYKAVCDDYMKLNKGTVSLVDCASLEDVAAACSPLFETYADAISKLKASKVQGFYTGSHPWYFDLRDVLLQAGATLQDLYELDAALEKCVEQKLYTGTFSGQEGTISIKTYCGLSMYLPSEGNSSLDTYYKGYDWNDATALVK